MIKADMCTRQQTTDKVLIVTTRPDKPEYSAFPDRLLMRLPVHAALRQAHYFNCIYTPRPRCRKLPQKTQACPQQQQSRTQAQQTDEANLPLI